MDPGDSSNRVPSAPRVRSTKIKSDGASIYDKYARKPSRSKKQRHRNLAAIERSSKQATELLKSVSAKLSRQGSRKKRWYEGGFPALRVAERNYQGRQDKSRGNIKKRSSRTPRSLSRGNSGQDRRKTIYYESSDDDVPYYRSKSLTGREKSDTERFVPVVNEDDVIYRTYTGEDSRPSSVTSITSRSRYQMRRHSGLIQKRVKSVVPHKRPGYSVDKLQAAIYQSIQKTYGDSCSDLKQKVFYERLAKIQLEHYTMRYMKLSDKDKIMLDEKFMQFEKLRQIAKKYEDHANERYTSQFEKSSQIDRKFSELSITDGEYQSEKKRQPKELKPAAKKHYLQSTAAYRGRANEVSRPVRQREDKSMPLMNRYLAKTQARKESRTLEMRELEKEAEQMFALSSDARVYEALTTHTHYGHGDRFTKRTKTTATRPTAIKPRQAANNTRLVSLLPVKGIRNDFVSKRTQPRHKPYLGSQYERRIYGGKQPMHLTYSNMKLLGAAA